MRFVCAMLTSLAITAGTAAAEQVTISGTVTLKFEPPRAAPARALTEELRRLRECGARWNQKLAARWSPGPKAGGVRGSYLSSRTP